MIRCLVTGGCGFIGSNLVHALIDKGWLVDVVDDMSTGDIAFLDNVNKRIVHVDTLPIFENKFETDRNNETVLVITGDFAHDNVLSRIKARRYDYVFHVAARPRVAYSVKDPVATTEINLFKTIGLFDACKDSVKRVVFSSSSSIFGNAVEFPTSEEHSKKPRSPYALQKRCCEMYAEMFHELYGLDIVCLRYFNVYGPHQYGDSPYATAIGAWCHAVKTSRSLRSDGDGTQCRDLTYIQDVVNANILSALTRKKVAGKCFNIGYGVPHSNNEILEIFKSKFPGIRIQDAPWRPGDVMKTHANTELAKNLLGYHPEVDIQEGLKRTFRWWGLEEKNE